MSHRIVAQTRGQAFCRLRCWAADLMREASSGRQPGGELAVRLSWLQDPAPRPIGCRHRFEDCGLGFARVCLFPADTGATNTRKALR
jgi:hypothetical protein